MEDRDDWASEYKNLFSSNKSRFSAILGSSFRVHFNHIILPHHNVKNRLKREFNKFQVILIHFNQLYLGIIS